ncbi:hypothetical protein HOT49_gp193 [Erwinia phage vB_EamM_Alexandra]|uniref:Tlde1 domain-containing protein n=1 Tax=Erwinia phage vB_EamM_Alexandra TaxID=2201424 RepID=A0A2Z4QF81_9CAUD|nr:hypothetical protein HOT49_gp193 [Erwinia phage vB_EamM_Alexandra]AWY08461.1 hypothetical protein Alexandra_195 [Erwinia phage vB_EamM_Alexandra]
MWKYEQSTGRLSDKNGKVVATGYAGKGEHKNKPASQNIVGTGPLPQGRYTINAPRTSQKTGPYAMDLTPAKENVMFGRASFQIHGDSIKAPGTASSGCIIMPRNIRELVWSSGDRELEVVV